jgi:mRNA-degrading endonuclease toxin of MazEF toxin-antitoxin module
VLVGVLVGAQETKVRPAVVIASATYLSQRPDVLVGILTTKLPNTAGSTDDILLDWKSAGLRGVLLPSIRTDNPSLGIDHDRPSQHARLGVR